MVPAASSAALAAHLLGREPRPSEVAMQAERRLRLLEALEQLVHTHTRQVETNRDDTT